MTKLIRFWMRDNVKSNANGLKALLNKASKGTSFEGYVDAVKGNRIEGWVRDRALMAVPLQVELVSSDKLLATTVSSVFRSDLLEANIGSGEYGFSFELTDDQLIDGARALNIRVKNHKYSLPWLESAEIALLELRTAKEGARAKREAFEQALSGQSAENLATIGAVDRIAPHFIEGWIALELSQAQPIVGEVFWGDKLIATGSEIFLTNDDGEASERRRFRMELGPHEAAQPQEFTCRIRIADHLVVLSADNSHGTSFWSQFDILADASVSGWSGWRKNGEIAPIHVMVDQRIIWTGRPRRMIGRHAVGFKIDLPEPEEWTGEAVVSVVLAETGESLGPDKLVQFADRFRGSIDEANIHADCIEIRGWVQDIARPLDSLAFEIHANGDVLAEGNASDLRTDLTELSIGSGRHGFVAKISPDAATPLTNVALVIVMRTGRVITNITRPLTKQLPVSGALEMAPSLPSDTTPKSIGPITWEGSIDTVRYNIVSGWARSPEQPDKPALLDLYINGFYYYSTLAGRHRGDVGRKYGDHGNYGFAFELPSSLLSDKDLAIRVVPRDGTAKFAIDKILTRSLAGLAHNKLPLLEPAKIEAQSIGQHPTFPQVAYIVLNLNAAKLLDELFASFLRHNRYPNYEFLVVDHGSEDASLETVDRWKEKLHIRSIPRGRNYSFSASNNFAARQTDAEYLVFLNNDIVFLQDITFEIIRFFDDPTVGIVGAKLLDQPAEDALHPAPMQHLGVHFQWLHREQFLQPFEARYATHLREIANEPFETPVVTGALLACRRDEFTAIGEFDEAYHYGYEDVDLCLRYVLYQNKRIICANNIAAFHVRGFSRGKRDSSFDQQLLANRARLNERHSVPMRRRMALDRFERPGFWTSVAPRIAFAVTEASASAVAGDYFTALELAREIEATMSCQILFIDAQNWYSLTGVDVLITMVDGYDLTKIQNASPHLIRIGWARNWVDRWATRPWAQDYDSVWASSSFSQRYLSKALAREVELVPIATNEHAFAMGASKAEFSSDYCFTGSYFDSPREIIYHLDPAALPFNFGLYGHGWEKVLKFAPYNRGPLPYADMRDVYASTKIVIDDANIATKRWGSVNSRVFDALAGGALVITNGRSGADEMFDGLLPSYENSQELEALLWHYLTDETARKTRVLQLQSIVQERHTYRQRATTAVAHIHKLSRSQLRFGIKIGAPKEAVRSEWGDYHFALGIKRALTRLGHSVRIDCLDRWEGSHTLTDDVVLVLRGLSRYQPKAQQINLMWNISHPDSLSRSELEAYDHIFVASLLETERLSGEYPGKVSALLQCTDPELFHPDATPIQPAPGLLFVGNSRNIYRKIVREAFDLGFPLDIYGSRWEHLVPAKNLKGSYIKNEELSRYYSSAACVLNDHWDDMRRWGFISNRLFDAAASAARIITDDVPGVKDVFGDGISTYSSREELAKLLTEAVAGDRKLSEQGILLSERVRKHHSFDVRVAEIVKVIDRIISTRFEIETKVLPKNLAPHSSVM